MNSFFSPLDESVAEGAHSLLASCGSFFTPFLQGVTILGNYGLIFIGAIIILCFFRKTRKAAFLATLALSLGILFSNIILKNCIARNRPFYDESSLYYSYWADAGSLPESGYSFPSGHTTAAMAFAMAMFLSFSKKTSWVFFLIPLLMGYSRIYFMVHYCSDVLAGIAVGGIAGALGYLVLISMQKIPAVKKILE
ncbi:MAG: phosphatase PAP2 family protein [Bacilli bacterium]|jgi:undecaprenyl-diphosphatase